MKKTILGLCLIGTVAITSCSNNSTSNLNANGVDTVLLQYHENIYKQAVKNDDVYTAIVELNHILYLDSTRTKYMDTLASIYANTGNFTGAKVYTDKLINIRPDDISLLEMSALIDQQTGNSQSAIAKLRKIYNSNNNPKYLYSIAANYLNIRDFKGTDAVIAEIKAHPEFESGNVRIDFQANDGGAQFINLDAATYYLEGFRFAEAGDKRAALTSLNRALKLNPNFQRAMLVTQEVVKMK